MNYDKVINICRDFLLSSSSLPAVKEVKTYLDGRMSKKAQDIFSFGWFPDNTNLFFLLSCIGEQELIELDLIYENIYSKDKTIKRSFFEDHNLVMPFHDAYGNIIGIVGRTILPEYERRNKQLIKYKNTVFKKSHHCFGLFQAKKSILEHDKVYVVEGQMDCIKAMESGIDNVVAIGSADLSFYQLSLLLRYTTNIVLILDTDEAGRRGVNKILQKFNDLASFTDILLPPKYKDLDDYLKENNVEAFKTLMSR